MVIGQPDLDIYIDLYYEEKSHPPQNYIKQILSSMVQLVAASSFKF